MVFPVWCYGAEDAELIKQELVSGTFQSYNGDHKKSINIVL